MTDLRVPYQNGAGSYENSVAAERRIYRNCVDVHSLPPIFHYWSQTHLLANLRAFGLEDIDAVFRNSLEAQCRRNAGRPSRFVSLGAGNCDLELTLARYLRSRGYGEFIIDCVDLNPEMLARGRGTAEKANLSTDFAFIEEDLNAWTPLCSYDAAIAHHSLHHVVNLERLFDQVKRSLRPGGVFAIADMIGRNGHQRWPEALDIVNEFWRQLPPSYRFNGKLRRYEALHENWDCSLEGFEGVRSQDILPLLVSRFHFELFFPFANVIDPFIDRSFGPHFDPGSAWDRDFIDRVHRRDQREIASGNLTPTHMLAVVRNERVAAPLLADRLTPECCIRRLETRNPGAAASADGPYAWGAWPHDPLQELKVATRRIAESGNLASEIRGRTLWALRLEGQLNERTEWALRLDTELARCTVIARHLQQELETRTAWAWANEKAMVERTHWAFAMEKGMIERTGWAMSEQRRADELRATVVERTRWAMSEQQRADELRTTVDERTRWALDTARELAAKEAWALDLERELRRERNENARLTAELRLYLHHPWRYLLRVARGGFRRVARFFGGLT